MDRRQADGKDLRDVLDRVYLQNLGRVMERREELGTIQERRQAEGKDLRDVLDRVYLIL